MEQQTAHVKTLLIDNYDSYTFNLFQLLAQVNGIKPLVVQNDDFESWVALCKTYQPGVDFNNVVISPGPGSPTIDSDIGICLDVLRNCQLPILGVCLGHQAMAQVYGGTVVQAEEPMHGRLSNVYHRSKGILESTSNPFSVVRYHSLVVKEPIPDCLEVTARTKDGIIMAIQHKNLPQYGLQFHPESIETQFGKQLIEGFKKETIQHSSYKVPTMKLDPENRDTDCMTKLQHELMQNKTNRLMVDQICLDTIPDLVKTFETIFGDKNRDKNQGLHFWLDSSVYNDDVNNRSSKQIHKPVQEQRDPEEITRQKRARFSYMGDAAGPHAQFIEFFMNSKARKSVRQTKHNEHLLKNHQLRTYSKLPSNLEGPFKVDVTREQNIFEFLSENMEKHKSVQYIKLSPDGIEQSINSTDLPFDFHGGYVGHLGYGLRNLCGVKSCGLTSHEEPIPSQEDGIMLDSYERAQVNGNNAHLPDAAFIFADRFLVVDHQEKALYLVALVKSHATDCIQRNWIDATKKWIIDTSIETQNSAPVATANGPTETVEFQFDADCTKERYKRNVERSIEEINQGETYEVCLTNQLYTRHTPEPFSLYKTLRKVNPSPFAAFISMDPESILRNCCSSTCSESSASVSSFSSSGGSSQMQDQLSVLPPKPIVTHENSDFGVSAFAICCSSPERFLRVSDGIVESKPIKGTVKRGTTKEEDETLAENLRTSVKDRAENLMIVDLVRNDLGRVCEVGSVCVPTLMNVESYATVHQLVSTVRGKLDEHSTTVDAIRAAFPGGSMTGAPKLRTMQIIDELEVSERGIYSGSLGFLSINGASDFNIVIRTAVVTPGGVSVGTGGAIVALSTPEEEYNEMVLKAKALTHAMQISLSP